MTGATTELVLLLGGAVVTAALATGVIVLIVRARREHEAELRRERLERERTIEAARRGEEPR